MTFYILYKISDKRYGSYQYFLIAIYILTPTIEYIFGVSAFLDIYLAGFYLRKVGPILYACPF